MVFEKKKKSSKVKVSTIFLFICSVHVFAVIINYRKNNMKYLKK